MYRKVIKRYLDILLAIILLIIAILPIMLIFTLLWFNYGVKEVFFKQIRPGIYTRKFQLIKFKTMNDKQNSEGNLLSDADRLTKIGHIIRKTSLDELPQLINVIKGDMSLVGPRPLLVEYLPLYNEHQKRRHEVKPGITGWAQVNGRNAISWKEKFELDVWYVDHCSFSLDMKILWLTILKVFKREGINQAGQATVEKFNGYN